MNGRRFGIGQPPVPPLPSGRWRSTVGAATTVTAGVNVERATMMWLPPGLVLQALGVYVVTIAATTTVRLGIRADDGNGMAGTLLLDAGTVNPDGVGVRSLAISFTVPAGPATGVPLWLTATPQGTNAPVLLGVSPTVETRDMTTAAAAALGHGTVNQTGVTGALPAGFTLNGSTSPSPMFLVQAA